jgi:hypothetical protein
MLFNPRFQILQTMDTNPGLQTGGDSLQGITYLSGGIAMSRRYRHQQMGLQYTGGGSFYSQATQLNNSFHEFNASLQNSSGRTSWALSQHFSYLPDSPGGFGGSPVLGVDPSILSLRPELMGNQSVFNRITRTNATSAAEIRLPRGARSSITLSGSYGLLRFDGPGAVDSDQGGLSVSYDRRLNRRSSLGINYKGSVVRFVGTSGLMDSHSFILGYTHQITGRMSLEAGGGPQITNPHDIGISNRIISATLHSNLNYRLNRTGVGLNYSRSVTGGAGAFGGSFSDQVTFNASRPLSRTADGRIEVGYSRNADLTNANHYSSWLAGANINRRMGRTVSLFLDYKMYYQSFTASTASPLRHVLGLGFSWEGMPIRRH